MYLAAEEGVYSVPRPAVKRDAVNGPKNQTP